VGHGDVTFELVKPAPNTTYWIAIRGIDNCSRPGPITIMTFTTAQDFVETGGCCGTSSGTGNLWLALLGLLLLRRR
jgi:hypothetical protein